MFLIHRQIQLPCLQDLRVMSNWMDPEVKKYFRKIMSSLSVGLLWLLANVTAGIYFKLGIVEEKVTILNILFFIFLPGSLLLMLFYFYKLWKK